MFGLLLSEWRLPMFGTTGADENTINLKETFNPSPKIPWIVTKVAQSWWKNHPRPSGCLIWHIWLLWFQPFTWSLASYPNRIWRKRRIYKFKGDMGSLFIIDQSSAFRHNPLLGSRLRQQRKIGFQNHLWAWDLAFACRSGWFRYPSLSNSFQTDCMGVFCGNLICHLDGIPCNLWYWKPN